ncbi:MAG: hypothetical protein ACTHN5_11980 [Phycisphaerae bacterium]
MHQGKVLQHLKDFAARPLCFSCRPLSADQEAINVAKPKSPYPSADERILNHVTHVLHPGISKEGERLMREHVGNFAEQFLPVYRACNGFSLYKDERSELTGVEILAVERWEEATESFKEWIAGCPDEYDPARLKKGVAIGYIPNAADGFVIALEGEYAGKIFLFRHSDAYMPAFADNFEQLILRLTEKPVELLTHTLGDYYRCSYGGREVWVPEAVVTEGRSGCT